MLQKIHYATPVTVCTVQGNSDRLREVIEYLLENALKYSPPDALVSLRVESTPGTVRLTVSDEGPGLSGADRPRLFKPFQRLRVQPKGEEGSLGLGLSLTKRIVEAHGGKIGVLPAPHKESSFYVTLPEGSSQRERTAEKKDRAD